MIGTPGFVGERLTQAREARGLTAVSLADLIGAKSTSVSNYERNRQSPSPEIMERIATVLNQPMAFFLRKIPNSLPEPWWRSTSAATKGARARARARNAWLWEIIDYLTEYVDFPQVNLPEFNLPGDVQLITTGMIEEIATECRQHWKLGNGPIADILLLMENNGIIVSRGELEAESLDAYSQRPNESARPLIFLGSDKASAARSRHDVSHELGHLILHRHIDGKAIRNTATFKLIEQQAHRFAAAFNLPAEGFAQQLWSPTLDAFLALKPHWKIAISAMIMRCEQLSIITEEQARRLWINMSRRGWRRQEPLDDRIAPEQPRLLKRSIELLINEGLKTPEQIVIDLALNSSDIESLACLETGYLSGQAPVVSAMPQLREDVRSTGNIIRFIPKRG